MATSDPPDQDRLIAVVGASGNIGHRVVDTLAAGGHRVRALGTDPVRLAARVADGVGVEALDLNDPGSFGRALAGVDALFLVRPPAMARTGPTIGAFVDEAERTGVRHVVFSSVAGADTNKLLPHHRIERKLQSTSMSWTVLRPGFFAQNFGEAYLSDILHDDRIVVPAGDGRVAFVDTDDIGDVAAEILARSRFENLALHLTGPEAITFHEAASIMTDSVGRSISYEAVTALGYIRHLVGDRDAPVVQALIQTVLHVGLRRGDAEIVTTAIDDVLQRPATTFASYVSRSADRWMPGGPDEIS